MEDCLTRLAGVVKKRRGGDPETSYIAKIFRKGNEKIFQKVGEEAVETVIAAMTGKKEAIVSESADLLFHLLLLWETTGVAPADVYAELTRRENQSGIVEKASRNFK